MGTCLLGRPRGSYFRVVFAKTFISRAVLSQGWDDWGRPYTHRYFYFIICHLKIYFCCQFHCMYKCYGLGAASSRIVKWLRQLSNEEAKPFLTKDLIGGQAWLRPAPAHFKRPSWITPTMLLPLIKTLLFYLVKVDQSRNRDFKKIQDAIDVVSSNNSNNVFISSKPFIAFNGSKLSTTIITMSDHDNIFDCPMRFVLATDFVARYLTIQNTYSAGDKAVALRASVDKAPFYRCSILSYHDTNLDDIGSHYYNSCYIEGATNFICGNTTSLFEGVGWILLRICHLHSTSEGTSAITTQRRESPSENSGFTFLGCKITGVGTCLLGRLWGSYSRVVFAKTFMSSAYKCYGPGVASLGRVKWSRQFSDEEAKHGSDLHLPISRPVATHFKRPSCIISNNVGGNK
ncbi:hypothetical protein NE237_024134 [Protea cynaroides]|uniref:pectinesterase n=1 Tax=Protea cynaroides TaxID=273540 RepID=A0A9Q0HGD5_9MAGN|nr:hypothetical protein NE237_024134 [Protea cynaroides]